MHAVPDTSVETSRAPGAAWDPNGCHPGVMRLASPLRSTGQRSPERSLMCTAWEPWRSDSSQNRASSDRTETPPMDHPGGSASTHGMACELGTAWAITIMVLFMPHAGVSVVESSAGATIDTTLMAAITAKT